MTDWHDPDRVAADFAILEKLFHTLVGLYMWEIIMNLDYEFSVFTGQRKLTGTFPLYLGCRWCPLVVLVTQFLVLDVTNGTGCQVMVVSFTFGYLSSLFASTLIILRISALWEHNKAVIALASTTCLANTACYLYTMTTSGGYWTGDHCAIQHTEHAMFSIFSSFATDLLLLVLMLIGILRWKEVRQQGSVWWVLYMQGLAWVVVFTLAEVPPMVFIILNLNNPMNVMFPTAGLIFTSVGASRLHRKLTYYLAPNGSPARAVDNKEQPGETTRGVTCPSYRHYPAGCTCGGRGAAPNTDAFRLPHESPQSTLAMRQGDGSLRREVA